MDSNVYSPDMTHMSWPSVRERQKKRISLVDDWWQMGALSETSRILDIGSGPGVFAREYASRLHAPGFVLATDASAEAVAEIESELDRAPLVGLTARVHDAQAPWQDLPALDVALATDMLHHTDEPRLVLEEAHKVAPKIIISEFDPEAPCEMGPPREMRLPRDEARRLLEATGWRITAERTLAHEHYAFVAIR